MSRAIGMTALVSHMMPTDLADPCAYEASICWKVKLVLPNDA